MINEKDLRIITELRENARSSMVSIASATNTPKSTVFDKIRKFEGDVIKKHTSIVDFSKLGYRARYVFVIKTIPTIRNDLGEWLSSQSNINNLFITNNEFDFLFEAIFKDNKEMADFKEKIKEKFDIRLIKQHELIEDIERERFEVISI